MSHRAYKLPVLKDGTAAHECLTLETTFSRYKKGVCKNVQTLVPYVSVFRPNGINNSGANEERITDAVRLSVSFRIKEETMLIQF